MSADVLIKKLRARADSAFLPIQEGYFHKFARINSKEY